MKQPVIVDCVRTTDWLAWLLVGLAVVSFVAALSPQWSYSMDPSGEKVTEFRLGLSFSPLFHYVHRQHAQGFQTRSGVNWISWSSLAILVGIGCLRVFRWRQARRGQKPAEAVRATTGAPECSESTISS
jgi:hypothetical protein